MKDRRGGVAGMTLFGLLGLVLGAMGGLLAAGPAGAAEAGVYHLAAGDAVRVTVHDEPDLSGVYTLDDGGVLALPMVGGVRVGGLSLRQCEARLEEVLADGWLRQPRVAVEVTNYRPFYILGEVMKPGGYAYSPGLSLRAAVALGGGFTYRADEDDIDIRRQDRDLDDQGLSAPVLPGDTITVGQRFF